jgi:hypothetical protein
VSNSIANLSSFTGLSEVELAKRAQDLVATGKIKSLNTLDAQLLASMSGGNQSAQDAISATAAQTKQAHVIEEPAQTLARTTSDAGFAAQPMVSTPDLAAQNSPGQLDKAANGAGVKIKGFVKQGSSIVDSLAGTEQEILKTSQADDGTSRELKFEQLKMQMQRMSEIFTALTNVLSNINDTQKAAINNIRG